MKLDIVQKIKYLWFWCKRLIMEVFLQHSKLPLHITLEIGQQIKYLIFWRKIFNI